MKKLVGALLSTMLIFGQPFIALAETETTGPKTINFKDIESIISANNLAVRINENEKLKTLAGFSELKRTIRDLEDDLEDVKDQRDQANDTTQIITLATEKRILIDTLEKLERTQIDRPTLESIADLQASMNDDIQVVTGEGLFIAYNKLNVALSDIALNIDTLKDQLTAMELQESLGLVSHNNLNELKTKLVDLQTTYQSTKFQQDSLARQLKNLLNDQEDELVFGSVPAVEDILMIEDSEADLGKALENSYTLKMQELQIIILQAALDRAKQDHGMSSSEYKKANYELTSAQLKLTQLKDTLKANYYTMVDDIVKTQSDLRLAEQNLGDKKIALSEAQLRKGLGMISQLDMDKAMTNYQVQENALKTKKTELFNKSCTYEWFLKGMPQA